MDENSLTEAEVSNFLITEAKNSGQLSPRVVIANRGVDNPTKSLLRLVRFALIISTDNEILVDALIQKCLDTDNLIYFVGSEVNVQYEVEVEYLYFEARIYSKKR